MLFLPLSSSPSLARKALPPPPPPSVFLFLVSTQGPFLVFLPLSLLPLSSLGPPPSVPLFLLSAQGLLLRAPGVPERPASVVGDLIGAPAGGELPLAEDDAAAGRGTASGEERGTSMATSRRQRERERRREREERERGERERERERERGPRRAHRATGCATFHMSRFVPCPVCRALPCPALSALPTCFVLP